MSNINRTVLHLDDDPDLLRIVKKTLEYEGYEVLSVSDPQEVLCIQKLRNVRLVLFDVDLPQMDGLDLLWQMKDEDGGIQAIILTGLVTMSTVLRAMRFGAETCIFKPITDFDRLIAAVGRAFEKVDRWWEILEELQARRKLAAEAV